MPVGKCAMTDNLSLLPLLTVVSGPMQGASFRLRSEICVIGRDDGVDILVEDVRVSRRHAVIERTGEGLTLADAGSTNGTWLNGRRLTEPAELHDGDRIRLGGVELRFYDPTTASTEPVGTAIHTLSSRPRGGSPQARPPPPSALSGPTQAMETRRRNARSWLVLGVFVAVTAGLVWAALIR